MCTLISRSSLRATAISFSSEPSFRARSPLSRRSTSMAWSTRRHSASSIACRPTRPSSPSGSRIMPTCDTKTPGHNVRVTEEFTVNIVDDALVAGMNVCAVPFPPMSTNWMAGLTAVKGVHVACPRIAEAPAALECRRYMTIAVGKSREIILGLVLGCFVREGAVNPITKHVDQRKMDAIGRLGGHGYSRIRDQFDLPTMSVDEWRRRRRRFPRRRLRKVDAIWCVGARFASFGRTSTRRPSGSAVGRDSTCKQPGVAFWEASAGRAGFRQHFHGARRQVDDRLYLCRLEGRLRLEPVACRRRSGAEKHSWHHGRRGGERPRDATRSRRPWSR